MKLKLFNLDLAPGLIDPQTRRSPFIGDDGKPVDTAEVPENTFWIRRVFDGKVDGSLKRIETPTPTGVEPVAPLTTR